MRIWATCAHWLAQTSHQSSHLRPATLNSLPSFQSLANREAYRILRRRLPLLTRFLREMFRSSIICLWSFHSPQLFLASSPPRRGHGNLAFSRDSGRQLCCPQLALAYVFERGDDFILLFRHTGSVALVDVVTVISRPTSDANNIFCGIPPLPSSETVWGRCPFVLRPCHC